MALIDITGASERRGTSGWWAAAAFAAAIVFISRPRIREHVKVAADWPVFTF